MDLKSLLIGAIGGATLYAAVMSFVEEDPATDVAASNESVAHPEDTLTSPRKHENSEVHPIAELRSATRVGRFVPEQASGNSDTDRARLDSNPGNVSASPTAQLQARLDTSASLAKDAQQSFVERAYAKLQDEPKNVSWAYDMEFAINQFLLNHPAAANFEIPYAECRTTHCQINAIGVDDSAGPTWEQIAFDMTRQPWYEFAQRGISSGKVDGRHMIVMDLYMVPPSERQ